MDRDYEKKSFPLRSQDSIVYHHSVDDAVRPTKTASPTGLDISVNGVVSLAFKTTDFSGAPTPSVGHRVSTIDSEPSFRIPHPPPMPPAGVNAPTPTAVKAGIK